MLKSYLKTSSRDLGKLGDLGRRSGEVLAFLNTRDPAWYLNPKKTWVPDIKKIHRLAKASREFPKFRDDAIFYEKGVN